MSDARLRQLQRQANQTGLPQDWARYYQEAHRAGRVSDWQLEVAAMLDHPAVKDWAPMPYSTLCAATKALIVDDRGRVIRQRIHDLADVWGGNIFSYEQEEENPTKQGLAREALLTALEITADKLHAFGWHKTLWQQYRESLRTPGWIDGLQAYNVAQLTNSYALGAPTGLVRDLMDATVTASNYFSGFPNVHGITMGFWRVLHFYGHIGRRFDQTDASYMLKFCEEFGKRLGDWVLHEEY